MRTCKICQREQPLDAFHKAATCKEGRSWKCKVCVKAVSAAWYIENREHSLARSSKWNRDHPGAVREAGRRWEAVPGNNANKCASRRTRKLNATPPWLSESQQAAISGWYALAARISQETGVIHHVDHIHPLQGVAASGLHVPWNLQILPAVENIRKGNR